MAFDCVKVIVVRQGSAILCSELGQNPITVGDAVLLCTNTLCAAEPEEPFTVTIIYIDTDYLIDQVFWQHVGLLSDRLDARELVSRLYVEPTQILHLGEELVSKLLPLIDELADITSGADYSHRFNRIQALWYLLADVVTPFVRVSPVRLSRSQRERIRPVTPRHRQFVPLRIEARRAAELLREEPSYHWTLGDLADRVHLSDSQLSRVFTEAFGKTPSTYLTMVRVEELARLLRETDLNVEDALTLVGWHSMSHAIRMFRQYIGMTPGAYRRIHHAVA